jgi:hypothetical protein
MNIYKDLQLETCVRPVSHSQEEQRTVKFKHIDYIWSINIYSQYGVNIYEKRDITKTLIREDSDLFASLFPLISASITTTQDNTQQISQQISQ